MPRICIITPVFNASQFIIDTVRSVQSQTLIEWRLILVDDCSTDNSLEVINKLAAEDKRIIVLSTGENSGPARARNIGIEYAISKGVEYLAFIDSDDLYEPHFLEVMVNNAEKKNADIIWCNYYEETYNKPLEKQLRQHGFVEGQKLNTKEALTCFLKETTGIGCLWNKLYRTSFIERQHIRINEERVRAEDWEFNLMLFQQLPKIYTVDAPLYHYVHQERASVMASFRDKDFEMYKRSLNLLQEVADKWYLKDYMPKQYSNFIYNTICYLSLGIQTNQNRVILESVCNDNSFQKALHVNLSWTNFTPKHKLYAWLLKHKVYCLFSLIVKILK